MNVAVTVLFFFCLFLVFYTYFGYGIGLWITVMIKELFIPPKRPVLPDHLPEVTLFITAFNEEDMVDAKMENCLSLDYPKEKLKIVWVTDGSTDKTNDLLARYPEVAILFDPERRGKTCAMNRGMSYVTTPFVIFTDANAMINKEAVKEIVRAFNDPKTGCIAGEKRVATKIRDIAISRGEGLYWLYESVLKDLDSRLCSAVGAAGELFAIRAPLYENMRQDTLLDDFVLSLRIVRQGYKIVYCKKAYAIELASVNLKEEKKRKVRIVAGGLQAVGWFLPLLNIFRYGCFSFLFFNHRVLRWTITPVAFLMLVPLNIALLYMQETPGEKGFYHIFAILQAIYYLAALIGWYLDKKGIKMVLFFLPYYFLFINLNVFSGLIYLNRLKGDAVWEKSKRLK